MEKHQFHISINAPREKVWNILWGDDTYSQWTLAFCENSTAKTDWKTGSKVLFLDGGNNGLSSIIADQKANEFISFKHMGKVKSGNEDFDSIPAKEFAGALENYTLKEVNGKTDLIIEMDISGQYKDYFSTTWPKALEKVKALAEVSS